MKKFIEFVKLYSMTAVKDYQNIVPSTMFGELIFFTLNIHPLLVALVEKGVKKFARGT